FRVSLPIRALFEAPTIAALAQRIDEARETRPNELAHGLVRAERDGPQPVSAVQEYVLRLERELPGQPRFNLPFAFRLQGPLNVPALERSLAEVVRRHDSLRTAFAWMNGLPIAFIAPADDVNSFLVVEDLAVRTPRGKRAKARLLKKAALKTWQEACTPFDLKRAPLFRTHLLRLGADDHVLLVVLHHIIVDGWSIGIFMEEVSELYAAFAADRRAQLSELQFQFSDFARWQCRWAGSGEATRQVAYWKGHLREASPAFPTKGDLGGLL